MPITAVTKTIDGAGQETGWHYFYKDPLLMIKGSSWSGTITVQYSNDGGTTAIAAEEITVLDKAMMLSVPRDGVYINVACLSGDYSSGSADVILKP